MFLKVCRAYFSCGKLEEGRDQAHHMLQDTKGMCDTKEIHLAQYGNNPHRNYLTVEDGYKIDLLELLLESVRREGDKVIGDDLQYEWNLVQQIVSFPTSAVQKYIPLYLRHLHSKIQTSNSTEENTSARNDRNTRILQLLQIHRNCRELIEEVLLCSEEDGGHEFPQGQAMVEMPTEIDRTLRLRALISQSAHMRLKYLHMFPSAPLAQVIISQETQIFS